MSEKENASFEENFNQLEEIVRKLEQDTLPLDESLRLFEQGIKLSNECRQKLEKVELTVQKLIREGETFHKEDFPLAGDNQT